MNLNRINIVLAVLLLIVAVFAATIDPNPSRPNFEFLPDMKYSPAYGAYAPNPNFANGRTLQAPVADTIARDQSPLHYAATKEDAERAGNELTNPFAVDGADRASPPDAPDEPANGAPAAEADPQEPEADDDGQRETSAQQRLRASIDRGAGVYQVFCVSCHGPNGAGDGPVTKRGFPPPPPLTTGKSVQMKDGQLFHILTYGQGSMSPMAAQLSSERRWDVINYVRGMQQSAAQSQQQAAADASADAPQTNGESAEPGDDEP